MKFSACGRLLATAGKDQLIRVWVLKSCNDFFRDHLRRNSNPGTAPTDQEPDISLGNNFFKRNVKLDSFNSIQIRLN